MNFACFYHSLASDWNHGNAHFLRGVCTELVARGHQVRVYEQKDNWSRFQLEQDAGPGAAARYLQAYPLLQGVEQQYELPESATSADPTAADIDAATAALDLDELLADVDVVLMHEWTPPAVVAAVGRHHKTHGHYRLFFHDTHHRIVSEPEKMSKFDLSGYDGILAFGNVLRDAYASQGWAGRVWTWHEAADIRVFKPLDREKTGDLVWVGNWGDDERTAELHEFLLGPVKALGLAATVHGVRYPDDAKAALKDAGIRYGGYLPNYEAPELFARHKLTVHVPRRWYLTHLPGIPTIRPFEALACGIPLVCSPWRDDEHLFRPGQDFLMVRSGAEMTEALRDLLAHPDKAEEMAHHGLETVRARHTCTHRTDELLEILEKVT